MSRDFGEDKVGLNSEVIQKGRIAVKNYDKFFQPTEHPALFLHLNNSDAWFNDEEDLRSFLTSVSLKIKDLFYREYYPAFIKYYGM